MKNTLVQRIFLDNDICSSSVRFLPHKKLSIVVSLTKCMARKNNGVSVIDLYCGVGGFSLGAARAGFNIVGAVDNDPIAIESHKKNFPLTKHVQADLSALSGEELLNKLGLDGCHVTGFVGGPPCQGFSTIGRNHNNDPRNDLFVHFYRLVQEIKPEFFVCENVPGIIRDKFKIIRETANDLLKDQYVLLDPIILDAGDFRAPTSRVRIFFIGFRRSANCITKNANFNPPKRVHKITVEHALKGLPKRINPEWKSSKDGWRKLTGNPNGRFGIRLNGVIPKNVGNKIAILRLRKENRVSGCIGTKHADEVIERWKQVGVGKRDEISQASRLDPKGLCPTLRAGTGREKGSYQSLRPIHPHEDRVITPREAARLQGFPDWFVFHSTKWHSFRQIGNSVSPIVAEAILSRIRKKIK